MLLELHVKNLALIEQADVEFDRGLNILTGETGAGKSIIIGSVNMALGGKVSRDMIRKGAEYAYIELVFSVDSQDKASALRELDVDPMEGDLVVVSRKITPGRSVSRINGETVTGAKLRGITGLLLDIHGQHEHQSLLYKSKHLEILDAYVRDKTQPLKAKIAEEHRRYRQLEEALAGFQMDTESRIREKDFISFEINEIEAANLRAGEEEELSAWYRRMNHGRRIVECLSAARQMMENGGLGQALKLVDEAAGYDEEGLKNIRDQLYDAEAILSDAGRELLDYMEGMEFDEARYHEVEQRLDLIHGLQSKFGNTLELILKNLEEKKKRLEELEDYEGSKRRTERELKESGDKLEALCAQLSEIRKKASVKLTKQIRAGLEDLNFIDVSFSMEFGRLDHFTAGGYDEAEFLISTNPGESQKPLKDVASGGELSRIMLAIKTVLADTDDIPTLIFDEIDTGISGRTAQKVSEKLAYIARSHQVICITHLPQIAAMADCHYEIVKALTGGRTTTTIRRLREEEIVEELARLLGGAQITEAVRQNAREMKDLADRTK